MDCVDVGVSEANRGMRFAYREFLTPGMLMLVLGLGGGLVILYAIIGLLGNRYTLSWNRCLAFCGVNGALCVLICYPAGALTLFLVRFRSRAQIALALALYAVIMAVPLRSRHLRRVRAVPRPPPCQRRIAGGLPAVRRECPRRHGCRALHTAPSCEPEPAARQQGGRCRPGGRCTGLVSGMPGPRRGRRRACRGALANCGCGSPAAGCIRSPHGHRGAVREWFGCTWPARRGSRRRWSPEPGGRSGPSGQVSLGRFPGPASRTSGP